MSKLPRIIVLAGVNGAGKSSIGGSQLKAHNTTWYNPDDYTRALNCTGEYSQGEANSLAWTHGRDLLEAAIANRSYFAIETTLGGDTIASMLRHAADTHQVHIWYCGLSSPELHIERVKARVKAGGHDIPEAKIRERWNSSRLNLIKLIPYLASLTVYDNSETAAIGTEIPEPVLLLKYEANRLIVPDPNDEVSFANIPEWARPILQAVLEQIG